MSDKISKVTVTTSSQGNPDENKRIKESADRWGKKVFNFVHKGHEYRTSDHTRAKNTCPHCGKRTKNGTMFSKESKEAIFLGSVDFGTHSAECFECNECFHKFFYHLEGESR